jgi:hypothetical protein
MRTFSYEGDAEGVDIVTILFDDIQLVERVQQLLSEDHLAATLGPLLMGDTNVHTRKTRLMV